MLDYKRAEMLRQFVFVSDCGIIAKTEDVMPRRKKPQATKRDWRWFMNTGLNVFVALSMVLGTVVLFTGGNFGQRAAPPTIEIPQDIPTLAPTTGAPNATVPLPGTPTPGSTPTAVP
jgi:hypothetical protein